LSSDLTLGSFNYEELFGISMAEGQYTGAIPVSGGYGSLPDVNKWGNVIFGDPQTPVWGNQFVDTVSSLLGSKKALAFRQGLAIENAKKRFSWDTICEKWETLFANGTYN